MSENIRVKIANNQENALRRPSKSREIKQLQKRPPLKIFSKSQEIQFSKPMQSLDQCIESSVSPDILKTVDKLNILCLDGDSLQKKQENIKTSVPSSINSSSVQCINKNSMKLKENIIGNRRSSFLAAKLRQSKISIQASSQHTLLNPAQTNEESERISCASKNSTSAEDVNYNFTNPSSDKTSQGWSLSKKIWPLDKVELKDISSLSPYEDNLILTNVCSGLLCSTEEYISSSKHRSLSKQSNREPSKNKTIQPRGYNFRSTLSNPQQAKNSSHSYMKDQYMKPHSQSSPSSQIQLSFNKQTNNNSQSTTENSNLQHENEVASSPPKQNRMTMLLRKLKEYSKKQNSNSMNNTEEKKGYPGVL